MYCLWTPLLSLKSVAPFVIRFDWMSASSSTDTFLPHLTPVLAAKCHSTISEDRRRARVPNTLGLRCGESCHGFKHTAGRSYRWRYHWSMRCFRLVLVTVNSGGLVRSRARRCRREIEHSMCREKRASNSVGSWVSGEVQR